MPSVFSFTLLGIYAIVDVFFVGYSIGNAGLSAINIAYPVSTFLQTEVIGIGIGGADDDPRTWYNSSVQPGLFFSGKFIFSTDQFRHVLSLTVPIIKVGLSLFGLTMTPTISLIIINWFWVI